MFRCFPPSTLGASSNDSSEKDSVIVEGATDSNNLADLANPDLPASNGLADCAPQDSPVAEAGPGVSYPGYKQYCR